VAIQGTFVTQNENHGRVGPNAIIRVAEALEASQGRDAVVDVFGHAGLAHYVDALPSEMVDECEVMALQGALRDRLGIATARAVSRDAGARTGDYLLARRIPKPAQALLSILPPFLASRTLIKAIRANAWTFVGTGVFTADASYPPTFVITDSLLCRGASSDQPLCDFYAGTYERLFRRLVQREASVTEVACHACGAPDCRFEVRW